MVDPRQVLDTIRNTNRPMPTQRDPRLQALDQMQPVPYAGPQQREQAMNASPNQMLRDRGMGSASRSAPMSDERMLESVNEHMGKSNDIVKEDKPGKKKKNKRDNDASQENDHDFDD